MRVDQWVPALHRGDAIGDSARLMRDTFRSWGYQADVYALDLDRDLVGDGCRYSDWISGEKDDVIILHYALPSPLTAAFKEYRGRRILLHHNITPPEFFFDYDPEMARICALGRAELADLRGHVDLGLGDSEFNRLELVALGFPKTGVLPIYLNFNRYQETPNPVLTRLLDHNRANLLFVGRIAPNKRHDDLIRLASYWKRFISPNVRLVLVGKLPRQLSYFDALQSFLYEEGFTPWEIIFTGHVDHQDLLAYYRTAHLFVSMSEHEGFGVPLVESMLMGVPILAYKATAVGHTLGDAGVQFTEKKIEEIAEMGYRLITDRALRHAILLGQERRLRAFTPKAVENALKGHLESL